MKRVDELGISPMPWEWSDGFVVCDDDNVALTIGHDICIESQETANGRLIAAAPELYECLRDAADDACQESCGGTIDHCCYESVKNNCPVKRWKKALAKAAGEEEK